LVRVDSTSGKIVQRIDLRMPLDGVAVGPDAVWAISGAAAMLVGLAPHTGAVMVRIPIASRPGLESPYPLAVAVGAGFVWVLDGNTASVTKIDSEQRIVSATIPIGIDHAPVRLAAGDGGAWVANGDGSLSRIDATTNAVETIGVSHRLKDVAVAAGSVWVAAGSGLSSTVRASTNVRGGHVRALSTSFCSPIYYDGGGQPRYLIASDLPLQGTARTEAAHLGQAIQFALRQRGFRAGRYAVG